LYKTGEPPGSFLNELKETRPEKAARSRKNE
jgi:hypothetical protein